MRSRPRLLAKEPDHGQSKRIHDALRLGVEAITANDQAI
jgi:hypothetical protein